MAQLINIQRWCQQNGAVLVEITKNGFTYFKNGVMEFKSFPRTGEV